MKKLSKIGATLIAASLLSTVPVWATQQVSAASKQIASSSQLNSWAKKALDKMHELIPELKEFTIMQINAAEEDDEQEAVVEIHLRKDDKVKFPYASIQLEPKQGEIIGFSINHGSNDEDLKAANAETAKQNATSFLKKLYGDQINDYQIVPRGENPNLVFFGREINGIPYNNGGISVFVNQDGQVNGFSKNIFGYTFHDKSMFPEPKNLIGEEAAIQKVADSVRLVYQANAGSERGAILKYVPEAQGPVDAKTGTIIVRPGLTGKYSSPITVKPGGKRLTAKNQQEAAQILKNELGVDISGKTFNEDGDVTSKSGNYEWVDEETKSRFFVDTDPQTGEVTGFGFHEFNRVGKPFISKQEAQQTALRFLQTYLHKNITAVHLQDMDSAPGTHDIEQFLFHLSHQGIPVENHMFSVTVDLFSGKVTRVSGPLYQQPPTLPDSKGAVTLTAAAEEFVKTHSAKLAYSTFINGMPSETPILIYDIIPKTPRGYIDALTGKTVE